MPSVSLFEQLTSSVSLSMVAIVSVVTLALILVYTVACRLFSSKKSKSSSSSKQQLSTKDKKTKEANTKKQQQQQTDTTANKKKKKNATGTPPPPVKAAVSSSSESEESEDEKVDLLPNKKPKTSAGKKVAAPGETNKSAVSSNGIKTPPSKQQQAPGRNENVDGVQSGDAKKKQAKPVVTPPPPNKQQPTGKNAAATNKVNTTTSNKKQPVVNNSEVKRTPIDNEAGSDQEDDGQWVTHSTKQVNNRNKNKGKNETSNTTNQESSPPSSNRKNASEKRAATVNNASSSLNKNEVDIESTETSTTAVAPPPPPQIQEPIEINQLLPAGENRYTASDDWWKQALNKQQTFTIADIGEWPEREQEEQYVVNVKRIIPVKNQNKTALSEKDINVDGNDEINNYKNGKEDEKLNFDEPVNSSSVVTGNTESSQSKKKSRNARRLS